MLANQEMQVLNNEVRIQKIKNDDYISLTDIAKHKNEDDPRFVIQNWMRTRFTMDFLGIWEQLNNPDFNRVEFEAVKNEAGSNAFVMTPTKWSSLTNAIGIISKSGRYGGTYAHKDIAFEFASWISAEFKLYLIKEFQRLKDDELKQLGWDIKRNLTKINYRIHTDAIKENLIPDELSKRQINAVYASPADLYDPLTMPPILLKAHHSLDKAVDAAYGKTNFKTEAERVAFLFELYEKYVSKEEG